MKVVLAQLHSPREELIDSEEVKSQIRLAANIKTINPAKTYRLLKREGVGSTGSE